MAVPDSIKNKSNFINHKRTSDWRGNGISLQQAMEKVPATELVEQ